jgi:hypothetical protein
MELRVAEARDVIAAEQIGAPAEKAREDGVESAQFRERVA